MHRLLAPDRRRQRVLGLVGAAVVIAAVVIVSLAATSGGGSMAPAFSAKQLASTPSDDWITNGGSISNDRYSALDRINTSNVAQLKGIWHVHLKSGVAAKYSGEAQPLEYKGVIYTITGADDVFASTRRRAPRNGCTTPSSTRRSRPSAAAGRAAASHSATAGCTSASSTVSSSRSTMAAARSTGRRRSCLGSRAIRSRAHRSTTTAASTPASR